MAAKFKCPIRQSIHVQPSTTHSPSLPWLRVFGTNANPINTIHIYVFPSTVFLFLFLSPRFLFDLHRLRTLSCTLTFILCQQQPPTSEISLLTTLLHSNN